MKTKYYIDGKEILLNDKNYLASGGQADIYVVKNDACKIYLDAKHVLPKLKIEELKEIKDSHVLIPNKLIKDQNDSVIGYTSTFMKDSFPFCKLFTSQFKNSNGIQFTDVESLLKSMQKIIANIHKAKCLVVDLNELNVLISNQNLEPFFIDVDSYQTPSFKASAIMESIRDRKIKNNQWNENSDWYSFAILSFWALIGMHPYRGGHPSYTPKNWMQRMEDGVSCFDTLATLPPNLPSFSSLPKKIKDWFELVFLKNDRQPPPLDWENSLFSGVNITPEKLVVEIIHSIVDNMVYSIKKIYDFENIISSHVQFNETNYFIAGKECFKEKEKIMNLPDCTRAALWDEINGPFIACQKENNIYVFDFDSNLLGTILGEKFLIKNKCIYSLNNGNVSEWSLSVFGNKKLLTNRLAANVVPNSTEFYENVIIQNILGKIWIVNPYEKGKISVLQLKELGGKKIVSCSMSGKHLVCMSESGGVYSRNYFYFKTNDSYVFEEEKDVELMDIKMISVKSNSVSVLPFSDKIELFSGEKRQTLNCDLLSNNNKLLSIDGSLCFQDSHFCVNKFSMGNSK